MTLKLDGFSRSVARVAVVLVVAAGSSACSSVPGWVDPTTWFGDDQASNEPADQTTAENGQTPDLADVPNKPAPASTADEQKQVADSLASDKARAQYSGDALRGGTEASAPPPPDAAPADQLADALSSSTNQSNTAPSSSSDQSASTDTKTADSSEPAPAPKQRPAYFGAPVPKKTPPPPQQMAQASPNMPGTLPAVSANAPAPAPSAPSEPAPAATADASSPPPAGAAPAAVPETKVAMAEAPPPAAPVSGAMPAVPASAGGGVTLGAVSQSDDNLGFQRSSAPALDPSISQFVSQPVMARYEQTASMGGSAGIQPSAMASAAPTSSSRRKSHNSTVAMGGPEQMSGAVVANFDSLQAASVAPSAPAVYADAGGSPTAVVFFPHDTTVLGADARAQVRAAVQAYQANGGQGFIRVVGHSSSGGESMSAQRRIIWNFERSQARAKAVAQELIREGIPANKVLVEAVGDQQPSQSEDGNRSAEIFLQS